MSQARVAVLTVSDTAAADTSLDKSGPTIRETLAGAGYEVKYLLVVPDDEPRIRHTVQTWVDQGDVDWIVTTGGTGFGVRDRTPEVTANIKGHVLAEDVYAPQDVPSTSTTSVDGYALRSTDPPGIYKVVTSKTHNLADPLPARTIFRINTGGPLPAGANTIVMVEDTRLHGTHKDASGADVEEAEVETLVQVPPGENVRAPGSDTRKGDLVLERGQVLHAAGGEIGTLAFVGRRSVQVYGKPVVAVLSTGNELLDLQDPKPMQGEWGGIWDTNRPSLQAALEGVGYQVIDLGIVPDDLDAHISALRSGVEQADLVLTTGGTSMGASDLLKPVIERHLGGIIHFGRVKVKPGKPTTFATIPTPPRARTHVRAPGQPRLRARDVPRLRPPCAAQAWRMA
ncbi:hypothetical protein EVJ58_g1490 [Rhodofomes roseus]|uniref:MoaB/Mog domain-containing protein n=1 Tax=Rhodofomes roseus TaxID=34475 RepID=A0A4Y9YZ69_9APHY|nr:hypothetical protein EVJ58_g1490 [Rhodofomes roseus]